MNKKHQRIIITGSIVTSLFLSNANFTLGKSLGGSISQNIQTDSYKPLAEHIEDAMLTGNLSEERLANYQAILQKVQAAMPA